VHEMVKETEKISRIASQRAAHAGESH